jgi:hypothetical protein
VARQIVHHNDVTGLEFENEGFCDINLESVPIDGTVEDEGRCDAAEPKAGDKGRRRPVVRAGRRRAAAPHARSAHAYGPCSSRSRGE